MIFLDNKSIKLSPIYLIKSIFILYGKYFGTFISAKATKCTSEICKYLGITLLPQAGVALGMCSIAAAQWPDQGALIRNITLFAVLIYELFGPMFTKIALTAAGEIKPISDEVKQRRQTMLEQVKAGKHK